MAGVLGAGIMSYDLLLLFMSDILDPPPGLFRFFSPCLWVDILLLLLTQDV